MTAQCTPTASIRKRSENGPELMFVEEHFRLVGRYELAGSFGRHTGRFKTDSATRGGLENQGEADRGPVSLMFDNSHN